jgi:hypothetical protein
MSKERAVRRAEREREAAIKAAARAAAAERRERRAARGRAVRAATVDRMPRLRPVGRHTGVLARRRRRQTFVLFDLLLVLTIVVWFVTDSWSIRLLVLIASVLSFPVLRTLLFPR